MNTEDAMVSSEFAIWMSTQLHENYLFILHCRTTRAYWPRTPGIGDPAVWYTEEPILSYDTVVWTRMHALYEGDRI